jgi:phosphogluconate dehydratase
MVEPTQWDARVAAMLPAVLKESNAQGMGRELFAGMRRNALTAEEGACSWL